jgi:hypothetical protein
MGVQSGWTLYFSATDKTENNAVGRGKENRRRSSEIEREWRSGGTAAKLDEQ